MKLILVNYEDFDCYNVGISYPVEFESKEALINEYKTKRENEEKRVKELYANTPWISSARNFSIVLCNLLINFSIHGNEPEFYTIEEWFEKYKDFNKMSIEEIEERNQNIERHNEWIISNKIK